MQTVSLLFACLFSIAPLVDCAKVSSTSYATLVMEDDDEVLVVNSTPRVAPKAAAAMPTMPEPVAVEKGLLSEEDVPLEVQMPYGRMLTEEDELALDEEFRIPMEEFNWEDNPQCSGKFPAKDPRNCEDRKCFAEGRRARDGKPCARDNCYCRCVVMSTGGRFCDEWVAQGCRDNDGCFRARDFPYLTIPGARSWRVKHPEVVLAALQQNHPDNVAWRKEVQMALPVSGGKGGKNESVTLRASRGYEEFIRYMHATREFEEMRQLTFKRLDLPMLHMVSDIEKHLRDKMGLSVEKS